jgi:hypothetical protein
MARRSPPIARHDCSTVPHGVHGGDSAGQGSASTVAPPAHTAGALLERLQAPERVRRPPAWFASSTSLVPIGPGARPLVPRSVEAREGRSTVEGVVLLLRDGLREPWKGGLLQRSPSPRSRASIELGAPAGRNLQCIRRTAAACRRRVGSPVLAPQVAWPSHRGCSPRSLFTAESGDQGQTTIRTASLKLTPAPSR